MTTFPRIVATTPHQEASIFATARLADRRGHLVRLYTTLHTAGVQRAVRRVPQRRLRQALQSELARRSFSGVSPDVVRSLALVPQTMRVFSTRVPRAQSLTSWLLYDSKKRFDRAVSRKVVDDSFDALISINFSAAATFGALRGSRALCVLNFIDSHPRYQNRYLRELCGLRDPHRELVFPDVIGRVETELEFADLVFVPSLFVAKQLEAVGISSEKVVIEPFGVDISAFRPKDHDADAHSSANRVRGLYVGQISHRKGLGFLLEAAHQLRGGRAELDLVGPLVSREVLELMPANVHYRGARLHGGVAQLMREVDFFVLPSVEDAFGLVALEAMACGLPVIVSDHVGASELITNGRDGLVVRAGDATALADAIRQLAEDADVRREIGMAARERAENGCSWDEYGERVIGHIAKRAVSIN